MKDKTEYYSNGMRVRLNFSRFVARDSARVERLLRGCDCMPFRLLMIHSLLLYFSSRHVIGFRLERWQKV